MKKVRLMVVAISAFLFLGLIFLSRPPRSAAQESDGIPAHLLVTVEPHHGADVPVINQNEVMVYEGHDRDKVVEWIPATGDHAALELFVLLDDSSGENIGSRLNDIKQFIDAQPNSTKIGVAYMQNGTGRIEQNLTNDHAQAGKAIRLPLGEPGINASPYISLSDLIKKWPESSARREVVVITDGIDRYNDSNDLQVTFSEAQDRFVYTEDATLQGIYLKLRLLAETESLSSNLEEGPHLLWPRIILTILRDLKALGSLQEPSGAF